MKTLIKLFLIFVLSFINQQNTNASELIRIGLIVPLSGEYKDIGNSILKSVRLAINKIDDESIMIIPKDTNSNPIDTLRVSKELHNQGVKIIIGPVFNESVIVEIGS